MKTDIENTQNGAGADSSPSACSPLLIHFLQEVIGAADAMSVLEDMPGQSQREKAIWASCSQQIKQAVGSVIPQWDDILKAAYESNVKEHLHRHE
jgi:hypothetical protein